MPLLPDLCAGQKVVEFLTVRPDAFAGIRDLYLRIGFEPTQACRDSGSSLTQALAKLHMRGLTLSEYGGWSGRWESKIPLARTSLLES